MHLCRPFSSQGTETASGAPGFLVQEGLAAGLVRQDADADVKPQIQAPTCGGEIREAAVQPISNATIARCFAPIAAQLHPPEGAGIPLDATTTATPAPEQGCSSTLLEELLDGSAVADALVCVIILDIHISHAAGHISLSCAVPTVSHIPRGGSHFSLLCSPNRIRFRCLVSYP